LDPFTDGLSQKIITIFCLLKACRLCKQQLIRCSSCNVLHAELCHYVSAR